MKESSIEKLVIETKIGTYIKEINKISGGLSHRMYKVVTDKGIYAIKELNPGVMKRKDAFSNFIFSEKVSEIAIRSGITAIGALKVNNEVITKIDDNYYMIFEWIDGTTLKADEITEKHCEIIGEVLAKIHNIDFNEIEDEKRKNLNLEYYDWNKYIDLAEKNNKVYLNLLKQNVELLYELNEKSIKALRCANENLIISHTDLDRKNVMWQDDKPFIIDWEASGYINPTIELIQVAWYWSGGDIENIDYNKINTLINSYKDLYKGNIDKRIEELVYADNYGGLGWLDYNLKRSLCIENNYEQDEIELAENEVVQSINEIKYNYSQLDNIIKIFYSIK